MKILVALVVGLVAGYAWSYQANAQKRTDGEYARDSIINMQALGYEFAGVPTDKLHIMRVWEDGSYEIEYQDGTSEIGCLTTGLCQD